MLAEGGAGFCSQWSEGKQSSPCVSASVIMPLKPHRQHPCKASSTRPRKLLNALPPRRSRAAFHADSGKETLESCHFVLLKALKVDRWNGSACYWTQIFFFFFPLEAYLLFDFKKESICQTLIFSEQTVLLSLKRIRILLNSQPINDFIFLKSQNVLLDFSQLLVLLLYFKEKQHLKFHCAPFMNEHHKKSTNYTQMHIQFQIFKYNLKTIHC